MEGAPAILRTVPTLPLLSLLRIIRFVKDGDREKAYWFTLNRSKWVLLRKFIFGIFDISTGVDRGF